MGQSQRIRRHSFNLACFSCKAKFATVVRRFICSLNAMDSSRNLCDRHRQLLMSVLCSVFMPRGMCPYQRAFRGAFNFAGALAASRSKLPGSAGAAAAAGAAASARAAANSGQLPTGPPAAAAAPLPPSSGQPSSSQPTVSNPAGMSF